MTGQNRPRRGGDRAADSHALRRRKSPPSPLPTLAHTAQSRLNGGMLSAPVRIRAARAEDMAAIGKVVVQLWRHTFTGRLPQDFLSSLTQDAQRRRHERSFARTGVHYRVAVDGSEVIGFASGGPSRDPNFTEQNELYAIFLMPDFERRGIGGRLFYSVISEFVSSERQGLYLTALAANPNREFYTKLGGIEVDGPSIQLGEDNHPQVAFLWAKLPSVTDCERP